MWQKNYALAPPSGSMRDYSCEKIRKYEPWCIIHCYLINAVFPSCFKQAAVPPLLMKSSTHPED